jgi:hypothetical protein
MKGEAGRLHASCDGVQEALLAGDVADGDAFGGVVDTRPGLVEQNGVALRADPDMIEAQLGRQGSIP